MYGIILTGHILVCLSLILIVLIQPGKGGGGFSGIFGGGGEALVSAPSGTAFMKKLTTSLAIAFAITSLLLTIFGAHRGFRSVTTRIPPPQTSQ